jgi:RNA polymerase sigma-70 factor (ECF subfamily)
MESTDRDRWSDEELLRAIAASDGAAFGIFYRRYLPAVLAYLVRETRDREVSADLAAEVFAAVLLASRRYRPEGLTAMPWVIGIARNKLLMSLRRGRVEAKARRALGFEALAIDETDLDTVEAVAVRASGGRVSQLFEELPDDERYAVRSRVLDERSYSDIADELECSEMVVRKRVSRGLARLRGRIGDIGDRSELL